MKWIIYPLMGWLLVSCMPEKAPEPPCDCEQYKEQVDHWFRLYVDYPCGQEYVEEE